MYTVVVDGAGVANLAQAGYDIVDVEPVEGAPDAEAMPGAAILGAAPGAVGGGMYRLRLVLWPHELLRLQQQGYAPALWRSPGGLSATQLAAADPQQGFAVWKPFDGPGGFRQIIEAVPDRYPDLAKLVTLGTSVQDRPMYAIKVTKDAPTVPDGTRPAVLYLSAQHAREWIGPEVNLRLMEHLLTSYGQDEGVTDLLDTRELWFLLVANPDGYQYTHDADRMWRKNLHDNDGDGEITPVDGVDLNRNFDAHWNYDNVGSSADPGSETYRGTAPASEPEIQAMQRLMDPDFVGFSFIVNYHSVGGDLLYGSYTWQVDTPEADAAVYLALSGDRENPAIEGFYPHSMLYLTNGNTREYGHASGLAPTWTPELTDGGSGGGFVFPDDDALVQREVEINLPFALDLAANAAEPAKTVSHIGLSVSPLTADAFDVSYGEPQPVQATAARYL
ncbi:MAG: M14 family metallopeptidase, partial [Acidimicrobiia bacterium]